MRSSAALFTTSLKLDRSIKERIGRLASARSRTPHGLMREAVEQYVEREEQREQLRQGALAAWSDYQTTGLHLTGAEADAWLAKLEAGKPARSRNATAEVVAGGPARCFPLPRAGKPRKKLSRRSAKA
jgi:predicted transcriptional regulator